MIRVLVTGGAGYIGSILVPALLNAGFAVTVIDNFMYRQNSLAAACHHPDFNVIRGDVRSHDTMKPLLKTADVIVPLAALVGAPACDLDPWAATSTNRDAIVWMTSEIGRDQLVIFPGTNSVYGVGEPGKPRTEDTALCPVSLYGRDKVETERKILDRHANTVILRLATVFGMSPRMRIDLLVNDFTYRAYHDGFVVLFESHFIRNYIHVRDVARAFAHAIDKLASMKGESYNVGLSDTNISKRELCERIQQHLPKFVFVDSDIGQDPDRRDYIVSNNKIERTGFTPVESLDRGLRELLKGLPMIRRTEYSNV